MIYFLKNDRYPLVLVGTARGISRIRRDVFRNGIAVGTGRLPVAAWPGLPPWFQKLKVVGMMEGDEAEVEAMLGEHGPPPDPDDATTLAGWPPRQKPPVLGFTPPVRRLIEENAIPWDGREQELLKIKPPERR